MNARPASDLIRRHWWVVLASLVTLVTGCTYPGLYSTEPQSGEPTLRSGPAPTLMPTATDPIPAPQDPRNRVFGSGPRSTLVLFDTSANTGDSQLYAMGAATLATHFGSATVRPVGDYHAGDTDRFSAVIYLGSVYDEPLPRDFLRDVTQTKTPVLWSGYNVWQLGKVDPDFAKRYGWKADDSRLDTADKVRRIDYRGKSYPRNEANQTGLVAPRIVDPAKVNVLATAVCPGACAPEAQTHDSRFPWAVSSANLTFVGEIPIAYQAESDRYLAFADLFYGVERPDRVDQRKRAAVRLEDVNPKSDPKKLHEVVGYLREAGVPFSIGVVPEYVDPKGVGNGGKPEVHYLTDAPDLVAELKFAQQHGGTLVQHGTTHQFGDMNNPYNGVTGNDFEFYHASCGSTSTTTVPVPCKDDSYVVMQGKLPDDTPEQARDRVLRGQGIFMAAGLEKPPLFETPHYAGTPAAYRGIRSVYPTRYERTVQFSGQQKPDGTLDSASQFFPYSVTDEYNAKVLPENLGNFTPHAINNREDRSVDDMLDSAALNSASTEPVASFFFHWYLPRDELRRLVEGTQQMGYQFVPASDLG